MAQKIFDAICNTRKKQISLAAIILAILLLMIPQLLTIPVADRRTQQYFTHSIKEAGEVYLSCRLVIGALGLVEHSQISLRPFGVGVQTEPGQMLDPVYDMAERASDVMVTSIAALTIEEIGYEITRAFAPFLLAILLVAVAAMAYSGLGREDLIFRRVVGLTLVLICLRVALPVSALVNETIHHYFFAARIAKARQGIDIFPKRDIAEATSLQLPPMGADPLSDVTGPIQFAMQKAAAITGLIKAAVTNALSLSQSFISLCSLYAGELIIQVIILPLLTWWVLVRIVNAAFDANLPYLIRHRRGSKKMDTLPTGESQSHP